MTEPTFYRGDTRSILDVILISDVMCTASTFLNCNIECSDYACHHQRVCLTVKIPRAKVKGSYRTARNWRTFDCYALLNDLANVDWSSTIARDTSCEEQWHAFSTAMLAVLDAHAPMRRFRVFNPCHPPVSDDTIDLMSQRRQAKISCDPAYQDLNVQTKRAIRRDCKDSISHKIKTSNPSALFRQLRPVIAPKRGKSAESIGLTPDQFNQYFTSIGTETRDRVAADFDQSGRSPLRTRLPRVNAGAMTLTPITIEHLKRVIFRYRIRHRPLLMTSQLKFLNSPLISSGAYYYVSLINHSHPRPSPRAGKQLSLPLSIRETIPQCAQILGHYLKFLAFVK